MKKVRTKKNGPGKLSKVFGLFTFDRLSTKEQTFFVKRLAYLINAGITVSESLHMLREQNNSSRFNKILDAVIYDISDGKYLSTALSRFKGAFGEFAINIIHVGETSGTLSSNLEYLAEELKKKQKLRQKVIGASVYPIVITVATIGITVFLMLYLFPKIMPIFTSLHMTLPLSTRIILFISNTLQNYGHYIVFAALSFVAAFYVVLKKSKKFHYYFDILVLKTPLLGKIVQYYNLANSTRTMGLLLKSGLTLTNVLPIVSQTTSNSVYKKEYLALSRVVDRGERMSVYLKDNRQLFPDVLSQITSVGERSGNLSNSFTYLSDLYESEVDEFTKNLSSLIEPFLMIFMGILVGFIAISVITPIYSISQNLNPR